MAKGRPEGPESKKSAQVLVMMTPDLYRKLEAVAKANQRRMGEMARLLLEAALDPDRGKAIREAMFRRTAELREAYRLDPTSAPGAQTEAEVLIEALNRTRTMLDAATRRLSTEAATKPIARKRAKPALG